MTEAEHLAGDSSAAMTALKFGALALAPIIVIYALLWPFTAPDLPMYLYPWIYHIQSNGPVGAFAEPFSNYTPPYLYLLAAGTLVTANALAIVKTLAALASILAAAAVWRAVRPDSRALEAAAFTLLLPPIIIDGAMVGQCDGIWTALCILAVAAAAERRLLAMVVWAGIAFAFKAQSAFIAPLVLAVLLRHRAPPQLWLVPPAIYALAMLPAWLAGWPAGDLATVYLRQATYFNTIGSASGLWAIGAATLPRTPPTFLWIGQLAGLAFVIWYVATLARRALNRAQLFEAALFSALALPFLLPKMHERFTLLADLLALTLAFIVRDRRTGMIAAGVITASTLAHLGYMTAWPWFPVIGCAINAAVLGALLYGGQYLRFAGGPRQAADRLLRRPGRAVVGILDAQAGR